MCTARGIGTDQFITSGRQDIGNGITTTKCGTTATMDRATGAGGGIIKERALAHDFGRQIFPELTAIALHGGSDLATDFFRKAAEV